MKFSRVDSSGASGSVREFSSRLQNGAYYLAFGTGGDERFTRVLEAGLGWASEEIWAKSVTSAWEIG